MVAQQRSQRRLSAAQTKNLMALLEARFVENSQRHPGVVWAKVRAQLEAQPEKLWSLNEMERTGGQPDLVGSAGHRAEFVFMDCSPESPVGRTSLCYDRAALEGRKKNPPEGCALDLALAMGVELLNEAEYFELQTLGEFDTKTSSWILTPAPLRKLGGALFGDRRFGRVFIYHNGADSYYSVRGFRCLLRI
jgi:hypothetical protein